jgi:hypothetical protein
MKLTIASLKIAKALALTGFAASVVLATSPAQAASFNIDFGSNFLTTNNSNFGAAANQAGQWNNITATGTTSGLKDTSNATTSVNLSLSSTYSTTSHNPTPSTDLQRLVQDSFWATSGKSWTVTLSGLSNGAYNVFYYGPSHSILTTGTFSINGTGVASIRGDNTTSFVKGTNYDVLNNVSVSDGTLTLISTSSSGHRGLSGLQLVQTSSTSAAVPEPLSILGAITAAGFGVAFKRKLAKSQK